MALAGMISSPRRASWNPLNCGSTELAPNLLLMAKLISLCWILKGQQAHLPEIFLPFLPAFDLLKNLLPDQELFQMALQSAFFLGAAGLFFNRWVRVCCLLLAGIIFTGTLACRFYYSNNRIFCAAILLLAGLQENGKNLWMFRWQMALVYFGAGLNKLLEPDWRSRVYFDYWLGSMIRQPGYLFVSSLLPAALLGKMLGWMTLVGELSLSVGFLIKRLNIPAIWGGLLLHSAALILSGKDFGVFTAAIFTSYLAFVEWPVRVEVFYNPRSIASLRLKDFLRIFDADRVLEWAPSWNRPGKSLLVIACGRAFYGLAGFKRLLLTQPVFYFLAAALVCVPNPSFRSGFVFVALLFFSPLPEAFCGPARR